MEGGALQAQLQLQLQLQLESQLQVHRRQYKRLPQYLASEIKAKFNCEIVIVLLEWPLAGTPASFPLHSLPSSGRRPTAFLIAISPSSGRLAEHAAS